MESSRDSLSDTFIGFGSKILTRPKEVGIVDDTRCEYHNQGSEHQESPDRVKVIRQTLQDEGIYKELTVIKSTEPTKEDLLLVHTNRYINKVVRMCSKYKHAMIDCEDVRVNGQNSLISASVAVGSVLAAVETVIVSDTVTKIYCNVRPPGHHASCTRASGFCIFNNIAIGAKKALTYSDINKVLIFDWDLHHGDGTESVFKTNKNVMYVSFHRAPPFYPHSGFRSFKGEYNNIHNYPLEESATAEEYMDLFYNDFLPKAREFRPDIVFISCGFDSHKDDLYHALPLDYEHFGLMTRELCELANRFAKGRLVSVLEGGYTLSVISKCVMVHIKELLQN